MVRDKTIIINDKQYMSIISDLLQNEKIQQMKQYRQHYSVNCFDHCLYVSYNTYLICKKHNLDYISAARAGLLHDLFLYDWRKRENGRKGHHAFTHSRTAYEQASTIVKLNKIEKDMILKHMWPVTLGIPKYKETFIITYVDKYFAIAEKYIKSNNKNSIKKESVRID